MLRHFILFILIFNSVLFSNEIIFFGEGKDILLKEAKNKALLQISEQISVKINSTSEVENYKRGSVSYNFVQQRINSMTNLIFSGVSYEVKTLDNNTFYVKAVFNKKSFDQSIVNLINLTNIDYSFLKTEEDFLKQNNYLDMLSAFLSLSRPDSVALSGYLQKKRNLLNKYKNFGSVLIMFQNKDLDTSNIDISIDNKIVLDTDRVFLPEGKHFLKISSKSTLYYDFQKEFYIKNKKNIVVPVFLHKKDSLKYNVFFERNYYQDFILNKNSIINTLKKNHILISENENNNYFIFSFNLNKNKKIYGLQSYYCSLTISLIKNNKEVYNKTYVQENLLMPEVFLSKSIKDFIISSSKI